MVLHAHSVNRETEAAEGTVPVHILLCGWECGDGSGLWQETCLFSLSPAGVFSPSCRSRALLLMAHSCPLAGGDSSAGRKAAPPRRPKELDGLPGGWRV